MTTFENMENSNASEKNNDRTRPDQMVESEKSTPGAILEGQGTAAHEVERSRNPVRSGIGGRVDERECEEIKDKCKQIERRVEALARREAQALKILSTMLGGPYA